MTHEDGSLVGKQGSQLVTTFPCFGTGPNDGKTQLDVGTKLGASSFEIAGLSEVDLIHAECGFDVGPMSNDQVPIDEAGFVKRSLDGRDDNELIQVGGDELGLFFLSLCRPSQRGATGKDLVDDSGQTGLLGRGAGVIKFLDGIELDAVADREGNTRLFEQPASEVALVVLWVGRIGCHDAAFTE
jgi:hypothetical protein